MAVKYSIATGNFTAAGTWGTVDATSYLNAENATESLLTTAYSGTRSSVFTPGAITVSHLAVKLCERIGTTGTMSVSLRNATIGLDDFVAGTEVTINTADLPTALEADLSGGWIFFTLAAPVLLLAATNYNIQAKTSSATQVDLWCDGTVDNISRCLVTTTTGAPAAGDDLIIAGEYTGAGTSNTFTVTMDNTATTDFGAASTSLVTPSLAICSKGILRSGVAASTAYYLKQSGNVIVYSGGQLDMGTSGTRIPGTSSFVLELDCGANVDFGLVVRNGGTWNAYGIDGRIPQTLLNTDEAAAATVIGVVATTGWQVSDELVFASTTRTATESEKKTILTVDSGVQVTLTAGLTNAHSGTSPTQGEVINITRNVKVRGASASLQAYIDIKAAATVVLSYVELYWLGSATALKRGVDVGVTTGSFTALYCALHDFVVASSRGFNVTALTSGTCSITYCVSYNVADIHFNVSATSSTTWTFDNLTAILGAPAGSSGLINIADVGGTGTNLRVSGVSSTGAGIKIGEGNNGATGVFSAINVHSCGGVGIYIASGTSAASDNVTITSITSWRNSSYGALIAGDNGGATAGTFNALTVTTMTLFGNTTANMAIQSSSEVARSIFSSLTIDSDASFTTAVGLLLLGHASVLDVLIAASTFGGTTTHSSGDIQFTFTNNVELNLNNVLLASATEIDNPQNLTIASFVASAKHDQTAGAWKIFTKNSIIERDTTVFNTASPSEKISPAGESPSLNFKQRSGSKFISVASGATLTPSVYARKATSYDGAEPQLILARNDAVGITADTVLDTMTAAIGTWEQLTGITAAASADGVMEFYVDGACTAGAWNVDDWAVA